MSSFVSGAVRAGASGTPVRPFADDRTINIGTPSNTLAVVSQEETPKQDEYNCPICVESLDASFRLPGEKAHVVPECGHTIHEVCAVVLADANGTDSCTDISRLALLRYMVQSQSVLLPGGRTWECVAFVEHLCGSQMSKILRVVPSDQAGMTVSIYIH